VTTRPPPPHYYFFSMNYQKKSYPVQQLTTGETLLVHAYTFVGSKPGPVVYLQGNLHGPELFGTALLGKLIEYLESLHDIVGTVIVVPCANSVGVQTIGYNGHVGRWHPASGINWNRIFNVPVKWKTAQDQINYYTTTLAREHISIEERLAATLRTLSSSATHVIDIHTTGSASIPHVFTYARSLKIFSCLGAPLAILISPEDSVGAFDESHVIPWGSEVNESALPHVCTWEAHCHNDIDPSVLKIRFEQLKHWLLACWENKNHIHDAPRTIPIAKTKELGASVAGYYSWIVDVGAVVHKGDIYAEAYQPWNQKTVHAIASEDMIVIGKYGLGAVASGERIAFVGILS